MIVMMTRSEVVLVRTIFAAILVLLVVASLYPAAQVVAYGAEARVAEEIPPVAV